MIQMGQQQVNGGARQARLAPSKASVRIRLHLVNAGAKKKQATVPNHPSRLTRKHGPTGGLKELLANLK